MSEDNYFSWENFNELAGIGQHIEFLSQTIARYNWTDEVRERLLSELDLIKEKQNDTQLNLSVIGEFSSGKSTFINSLIRCKLLSSSVLQGTTVVPTVIEYNPRLNITLEYRNGKKDRQEYNSLDELRKNVSLLSTSIDVALQLKLLRVGLPSESLYKGMRIIDTPGTNALEEWHEEVTRSTLNEVSDLSIVLIDPMRPVSQSLIEFLKSAIPDLMGQSIYVITKFDTLPEKEQNRMSTFVEHKISNLVGKTPIVVKYSAMSVLDNMTVLSTTDNRHVKYSLESETHLFEYMSRNRQRAISHKLVSLINILLENLEAKVNEMRSSSLAELAMLERSKNVDLSEFIRSQILGCVKKFSRTNIELRKNLVADCDVIADRIVKRIDNDVDAINSIDALKLYASSNNISTICNVESQKMLALAQEYQEKQYESLENILYSFSKDFEQHFLDLDLLQVTFDIIKPEISAKIAMDVQYISDAKAYVSDQLNKENRVCGSGAAIGAMVGTFVVPMIGTIVGGLLGVLLGLKWRPDFSEVRKNFKTKIKDTIDTFIDTVRNDTLVAFTNNSNAIVNIIDDELSRYPKEYKKEVDNHITDYKAKHAEIIRQIENIDNDLSQIKNHKILIKSLIRKLKDGNDIDY